MSAEVKASRRSGIELLKILAMLGIVIFHCHHSMDNPSFLPYGINLRIATTSVTILITQIFFYLGNFGNLVFLVCSSWFLIDSKGLKINKIAYMAADVFAVSVIMLALFLNCGVEVSMLDIKRSLLPTTFMNNWYITTYLMLYAIHPLLNIIINKLSQRQLLAYNAVFFILYGCLIFLKDDLFFYNSFLAFIVIYFFTAYLKKYMPNLMNSKKANTEILAAGIIFLLVLHVVENFVGLHTASLFDKVIRQAQSLTNPILLIIVFALFNKFRLWEFKSKTVNYLSSLTLLIYIFHENFIFRDYVRTDWILNIWLKSGRMNIIPLLLLFSICLFAAAALVSVVYSKLFQPIIHKAADKILGLICRLYAKLETLILKKLN